jgi:hypothetical protein
MNARKTGLALGALLIWGATPCVAADESATATTAKPATLDAVAATVTATVEDINHDTRELTLKGPKGNTVEMQVGPEVARFKEIQKGDKVTIDYLASVAIVVDEASAEFASAEGSGTAIVRNQGKKPSGVAVATDVMTGTIDSIDATKRTATLRGPQGNTVDVTIAPDVRNVENLKKGDQVKVKVTRALAIDVSAPDATPAIKPSLKP